MLLEFSFKNFKSYREETCLDLSASRGLKKKDFHVRNIGSEKILPCAVIFGANASGKSNVYEAFVTMRNYVLNSFSFGNGDDLQFIRKPVRYPFLFNKESIESPTEFEVFFAKKGIDGETDKTWQYGFLINNTEILEEWLSFKEGTSAEYKTVFTRELNKIESPCFSKETVNTLERALNKETLVISLGSKTKVRECETVFKVFTSFRTISFSSPIETFVRSSLNYYSHAESYNESRPDIASFLAKFDPSIKGIRIKKISSPSGPSSGQSEVLINAVHQLSDKDPAIEIPLANESGGTQKMFLLYNDIKKTLESGGLLFIDELSARLHPLLHLNILAAFLDPYLNKNSAQLIITSHDVALLSVDYLRDDEIWIAEKDRKEESKLYSLSEFKDASKLKGKKGTSLLKNYLLGRLGGIPVLESIEF